MASVAKTSLSTAGESTDLRNIDSRKFILVFDFEDELRQKFNVPLWTFLTNYNDKAQRQMWDDTFDHIMQTVRKEKPKNVFIGFHATFFKSSRFFSVINQDKIAQFKPDLFVTLIDDTYAVWQRIVAKSASGQDKGKSYLRLRDILSWRAVELLVTDLISDRLTRRDYMVSVKHPSTMLFNLIFHPEKLFIYASYPISKTRFEPLKRKEIDDFRYKLHEDYVVFDPLTIDEKIMGFAASGKDEENIDLSADGRWPLKKELTMVCDDDLQFPLRLKRNEILEVEKDIDDYIEARDYRLVSQADALVAYRPYYGGESHRGINSEIMFATHTMKERYFYVPEEDEKQSKSPFKDKGVPYTNLEDMYKALRGIKPEDKRPWKGV